MTSLSLYDPEFYFELRCFRQEFAVSPFLGRDQNNQTLELDGSENVERPSQR